MSDLSTIIQKAQLQFLSMPTHPEEVFSHWGIADPLNDIHRSAKSGTLPSSELARIIDHTLLKPDVSREAIRTLCEEARRFGFASVCVNSSRIALAREFLAGAMSDPVAVVGFPLGACTSETKVFETTAAIGLGAREIDMVLAIGALKDGDYPFVFEEIRAVVHAARAEDPRAAVKVILETALLSAEEKVAACVIAREAGAQFLKTSTGFSGGGATEADIRLMRAIAGNRMKVKASGGIRTRADALRMIAAGADRIGASASVGIVDEAVDGAAAGSTKSEAKDSKGDSY